MILTVTFLKIKKNENYFNPLLNLLRKRRELLNYKLVLQVFHEESYAPLEISSKLINKYCKQPATMNVNVSSSMKLT